MVINKLDFIELFRLLITSIIILVDWITISVYHRFTLAILIHKFSMQKAVNLSGRITFQTKLFKFCDVEIHAIPLKLHSVVVTDMYFPIPTLSIPLLIYLRYIFKQLAFTHCISLLVCCYNFLYQSRKKSQHINKP